MNCLLCCGIQSQTPNPDEGIISIVNVDRPHAHKHPRSSLPNKDPSDNTLLVANSNHPTHSNTSKHNSSNTPNPEVSALQETNTPNHKSSTSKPQENSNPNQSILSNKSHITFQNLSVNNKENSHITSVIDTELMNYHELRLSNELVWGKEVLIDRLGIKMGKRKSKKGISIFGVGSTETKSDNGYINDFIINLKNNDLANKNVSIFSIEFEKGYEKFLLKRLSKKVKVFLSAIQGIELLKEEEQCFYVGKVKLKIMLMKDYIEGDVNVNKYKLRVKVKKDKKDWQEQVFSVFPVTIGRSSGAVIIKNNSISKVHAVIDYNKEYEIYYIKDMQSTNGTYRSIHYEDCVAIKGEMVFKIFETKLIAEEYET